MKRYLRNLTVIDLLASFKISTDTFNQWKMPPIATYMHYTTVKLQFT